MITAHRTLQLLWGLLLLSPIFLPNVFDGALLADTLTLIIGLLFAAVLLYSSNHLTQTSLYAWLFFVCLITPIYLGLLLGDVRNPWVAWRFYMTWASCWLIFVFVRNANVRDFFNRQSCLIILLVIINFSALLGIIQTSNLITAPDWLFPILWAQDSSFSGFMHQRNSQSLLMALGVLLSLLLYGKDKSFLWLIAMILPILIIMSSSSRSGFILLMIALLIAMRYINTTTKEKGSILLIAILAATFGSLLPDFIILLIETFSLGSGMPTQSTFDRFASGDTHTRLWLWAMSFHLGWTHLFTGIGYGNMAAHALDVIQHISVNNPSETIPSPIINHISIWSHNIWLQAWMEGGIILFSAFSCLTVIILKRFIQILKTPENYDLSQKLSLGFLVLWLASGAVSVAAMQPYFIILAAIFYATSSPQPVKTTTPQPKNILIFIPCIIIGLFWFQGLQNQIKLKQVIQFPIASNEYIATFITMLDRPWVHARVLFIHFIKLRLENTSESIWAKHHELALMQWYIAQTIPTLNNRIHAAKASSNILEQQRLESEYAQVLLSHKQK